VQRKAQAEIDAVIGNGRLPTFTDRPDLPYVDAIVTEVLRWNSVAPTGTFPAPHKKQELIKLLSGVPHTATEDGIIHGYHIPKGSIIIANLW
jgi:cytochrome P450